MRKTAVKVCGLTRPEDVAVCHAAGVVMTGFIFAAASPRRVTATAVATMPCGPALRVGVFAEGDAAAIARTAREAKLDLLQLHGRQSVTVCETLGSERIIKVLWPEQADAAELARQIATFAPVCAYFLFDSGTSGGGSGRSFAWERLGNLDVPRPWVLAGGIGPDTVAPALAACHAFPPWGIDCNSGVERAPGIKDAIRIRAVMAAIATHTEQEG